MKELRCPNCNHRLFDLNGTISGSITIKCDQCKQMVILDMRVKYDYTVLT